MTKQSKVGTSKEICSEVRKTISKNTDNCPKVAG